MERLILDSSVIIAVHRGAMTWEAAFGDEDPAIAAITAAELLHGVERADGAVRARRSTAVERTIAELPVEVYDLDVARHHGALLAATARAGSPRGAHDLIIAATARATNRTVVTLDRAGFDGLPGVSVRVPTA